jgi:hypothetical protein
MRRLWSAIESIINLSLMKIIWRDSLLNYRKYIFFDQLYIFDTGYMRYLEFDNTGYVRLGVMCYIYSI